MATEAHSAYYLPNAPLQEAVVSLKWALPSVGGARYDRELDLALGRFYEAIREDYPRFSRLQAGPRTFSLVLTNYQPVFRFASAGVDVEGDLYPLLQLGSGILTANEHGRRYDFETFSSAFGKAVDHLLGAYPPKYLQLVNLEFLLVNRLELAAFETFLRAKGHRGGGKLKASAFFADYLGLERANTYEDLDIDLLSQEVLRTYALPRDVGEIDIRYRDDSETGGEQVAYWEINARTAAQGLPLTRGTAISRLESLHTHTRAIFTAMVGESPLLDYFKLPPPTDAQ